LHFTESELAARRERAVGLMQKRGLDGLLMFRQESMYYLTGYDTFGYVFFQCLYLGADGRLTLLTRAPDLRQAQHTSVIEDIRIWVDGPDADPCRELKAILDEHGCRGRRLGVELEAYGLTARNGLRLMAALDGFCTLIDASDLVSRLRLVKSPAEIVYVRRAAELADPPLTRPAGRPGAEATSSPRCSRRLQRRRRSGQRDHHRLGPRRPALPLFHRPPAFERRGPAHARIRRRLPPLPCLMRTIGQRCRRGSEMHAVAVAALEACKAALRPGRPIGEVFDAHAAVLDGAGYRAHRMNATGYSVGATFAPNWMDWPMLYHGNPEPAAPGMVFFIHIIIFDSESGLAMTTGQTVLVTDGGSEALSRKPLDLVVN
jgi:Xaa-Pro dipeptidase